MARSKSKHVRLRNRRRAQTKQRMQRIKARKKAVKPATGGKRKAAE